MSTRARLGQTSKSFRNLVKTNLNVEYAKAAKTELKSLNVKMNITKKILEEQKARGQSGPFVKIYLDILKQQMNTENKLQKILKQSTGSATHNFYQNIQKYLSDTRAKRSLTRSATKVCPPGKVLNTKTGKCIVTISKTTKSKSNKETPNSGYSPKKGGYSPNTMLNYLT